MSSGDPSKKRDEEVILDDGRSLAEHLKDLDSLSEPTREWYFLQYAKRADKCASAAHDAIYADPFDKQAASEAIWRIHDELRPLIAVLEKLK
jgi:hypothetical protein